MAKRKRTGFGPVFMLFAFATIGAFMYWLSVASAPTVVAVASEEPVIPVVTLETFAEAPAMYVGTEIELTGAKIVDNVGSNIVWFELPGDGTASYLARMDPQLVEEGLVLLPGDLVSLIGSVEVMSESTFQAWTQEGVFVGGLTTARDRVGQVVDYFMTREVRVQVPDAPAAPAAQ
jgi:hypothetical protein